MSSVFLSTGPREEITKFVKAASHHSVCRIECLLYSIPMMAVYVNVEDSGICSEKFKNGENNIVDETESRSFSFLRVMKTASPIDCNVRRTIDDSVCSSCRVQVRIEISLSNIVNTNGTPSRDRAEFEKSIECWIIFPYQDFDRQVRFCS